MNEGQPLTIAASFTDAAYSGPHRVRLDWSDGRVSEVVVNSGSTVNLPHTYLDGLAGGTAYLVQGTVLRDNSPARFASASLPLHVRNIAPTVGQVTVEAVDHEGEPAGETTSIREGETVVVSGSFTPGSVLDQYAATINWGDGTTSPAVIDSASRTFRAFHRYLDDGISGTADDPAPIVVTVSEVGDPSLFGQGTAPLTVSNVNPSIISLVPVTAVNGQVTLIATVADPGNDHFSFRWLLSAPPIDATTTTGTFVLPPGVPTGAVLRLELLDDDQDPAMPLVQTTKLFIGTPGDDVVVVTPADLPADGTADRDPDRPGRERRLGRSLAAARPAGEPGWR